MATNEVDPTDTEVLQFSLTDPDHLSEQLDAANLNDEETDLLFQEAVKLNAHLKEVLRHQQLEEGQSSSKAKSKKAYGQGHPLAAPKAPRNPRQSTLPPIVATSERSREGLKNREAKTKSLSDAPRVGSASKRKGSAKKSVANRPAWDDRFSFS